MSSEDTLDLILIKTGGGTQSRTGVDKKVVEEYAEAMQNGVSFPPVDVFHDGRDYWLADGFHRYYAASKLGLRTIGVHVHQGTRREAILHSVGANSQHGLRRTNADKQRAVEVLLKDEEWVQWSDREIARRCGVNHVFVGKVRKDVTGDISSERIYTTKHGTTATMQTNGIGKTTIAAPPSLDADLEQSRRELGRGGMLAVMQSEADNSNKAIAVTTEELPPIMAAFAEDQARHQDVIADDIAKEGDDDEDELESFMPYSLYAAHNSEEVDYLIDKLGRKAVAEQFAELVSDCDLRNQIREFYPGIDALVAAELGEDVAEAIKMDDGITAPQQSEAIAPIEVESVEEVINTPAYRKMLEAELSRLRNENNKLWLGLMQCRKAAKEYTFVGDRVKVVSEESANFGRVGLALQSTIKQRKNDAGIETTYSVQLDGSPMKNSFLENELVRFENE